MLGRDSGLSHHTRNPMMGSTGNVFENPPAPETKFSVLTRNCRETWKWIETRTAEFDNTDSTIFLEARYLELNASHWRKLFSKVYDGSSEVCYLGFVFSKFQDSVDFQFWKWKVNCKGQGVCKHTLLVLCSQCCGSMKWRWRNLWTIFSLSLSIEGKFP